MVNKIFISHSTKNAWLLEGLMSLIREVDPGVDIFCSSEAVVIPSGANYKEVIYSRLSDADMFIAILSNEYWTSRYAILELGAAYQRYCFDHRSVSIQPVLVPPLDKDMALANTPLVELQIEELADPKGISMLLREIAGPENAGAVDSLNVKIAEYAGYIRKSVLKMTSLTQDVGCGAYYDEPAGNPVPKDRIVRAHETEPGRFLMEFHLSRLPAGQHPAFVSLALEYWDEIDFTEYLVFDKDAAFSFTLDDPEGALRSITVEFKFGETHKVYKAEKRVLEQGINQIRIPLQPMNHKPLSEINQICFVVTPEDMNCTDGEFVVSDIEVQFEAKNILE